MNRPSDRIPRIPNSVAEGSKNYLYTIHVRNSENGQPIIQLCPQRRDEDSYWLISYSLVSSILQYKGKAAP